ncbi:MAG TPA: DUF1800 domain-containing protein [Burkholderiaceae bacterium]|nr:DUF1800 domain-containing protein [Burkholderiaceae bacterium]
MTRWLVGVVSVLVLVASSVAPAAEPALGVQGAKLLLTRAGFAPNDDEIAAYSTLSHAAAVDRLLAGVRTTAVTAAPAWIDERFVAPRELRTMSDEARRAEIQKQVRMGLDLRGWWLREMVQTPSPLTERMTLFWHNHFVSAQPKVRYTQLMYRQNALLRAHALGRFDELLHAVAKDPAMLIYLDSATNRRGSPNENFAREVMELFTLGEGRYSEEDIKQAARAFTGWSIDVESGGFMFRRLLHDDGEKTVFGKSGKFDGDAVLDIILAQPGAAEFIVRKLWREFVSSQPDEVRVRKIAAQFRSSGWSIAQPVRALLLQPEVIARDEDNALVKSPADLMVGFVRQSGARLSQPVAAAVALAGMGQNLFSPPNVRGWPGGDAWINTHTLLARKQFLERALNVSADAKSGIEVVDDTMSAAMKADELPRRGLQMLEQTLSVRVDAQEWLARSGLAPERVVPLGARTKLEHAVLAVPATSPAREGSLGLDALRAIVLDPAYQLK